MTDQKPKLQIPFPLADWGEPHLPSDPEKLTAREAKALGLPHAVAGLIAAAIAQGIE